eukprot:CAMPEP_0116892354 /NCGR_PEP_ID=MMETSP0467-20121206/2602_1 /TAXON_ID=283647 /ORGANISM="Mesodinium pulex, Strain SPMC105" /LENGTH=140 /DNA_ID=CAMNT_0004561449 /DNA_START=368 /DNA_END=790 /DNA_ORIENTATION=+
MEGHQILHLPAELLVDAHTLAHNGHDGFLAVGSGEVAEHVDTSTRVLGNKHACDRKEEHEAVEPDVGNLRAQLLDDVDSSLRVALAYGQLRPRHDQEDHGAANDFVQLHHVHFVILVLRLACLIYSHNGSDETPSHNPVQ